MLKRIFKSIEYRLIQKTLKPKTYLKIDKIGDDYGFCFLPENFLNEKSVFYSFGAGEDIFVEVELSKIYNCESHIFDPTPKSIKHFADFKKKVNNGVPMSIDRSSDRFYKIDKEKFKLLKYYDCGIWNKDTKVDFYLPENDDHVSCSINNIQNTNKKITVPVKTLKTLMKSPRTISIPVQRQHCLMPLAHRSRMQMVELRKFLVEARRLRSYSLYLQMGMKMIPQNTLGVMFQR